MRRQAILRLELHPVQSLRIFPKTLNALFAESAKNHSQRQNKKNQSGAALCRAAFAVAEDKPDSVRTLSRLYVET